MCRTAAVTLALATEEGFVVVGRESGKKDGKIVTQSVKVNTR